MSIRVNRSDTWNDYFFGKDYFYDITYANEPLGITLDEFTNTRGNTEKDLLNKLINERALDIIVSFEDFVENTLNIRFE